jgi:hypothetical protein
MLSTNFYINNCGDLRLLQPFRATESAFGQDGALAELKAQSRRHEQSTTDAV